MQHVNSRGKALLAVQIVINNYNYGRYLTDAVESALSQDYPDTRVIIVDDGSTDATPEIIRSYGDRVRSLRQPKAASADRLFL